MVSNYAQKDQDLVNMIRQQLVKRTLINMNENENTARSGDHLYENIYPEVTLTPQEIKNRTGRKAVRGSALDSLKTQLEQNNLNVKAEGQNLIVSVPEQKNDGVTYFRDLDSLLNANEKTVSSYQQSRQDFDSDEDYEANDPTRNPFD